MPINRHYLTLQEKIKLIETHDKERLSVRILAQKFDIGKSQVSTILKQRESLLADFQENGTPSRKRRKVSCPYESVNSELYEWFSFQRSKNVPLSGPLICQKALEIARSKDFPDFKASQGWLTSWKKAHNIAQMIVSGESGAVNPDTVADWAGRLQTICEGYQPSDIFNADETGLFFRAFPNKSLAVKGSQCRGGKNSKDRLSLLLTASMAGEKLTPWLIGKAARPRCFKNIVVGDLPVVYRNNKKAWMTAAIFEEYLRWFNRQMVVQNRHVLLFVDNAPCHPRDIPLSNVTVRFLPANTTSITQPCDLGIIKNVKVHYQKQHITSVISHLDAGMPHGDVQKSTTIYDAAQWISRAWRSVKSETITRCFRKAGFTDDAQPTTVDMDEDDLPLSELQTLLRQAGSELTSDEYLECDRNLDTDCTQEQSRHMLLATAEPDSESEGEDETPPCGNFSDPYLRRLLCRTKGYGSLHS